MKMLNYAVNEGNTKGRLHQIENSVERNPWERDRSRILHSAAFRRLQYKTQVFENGEGDNFRTRLTHSIEVSQIAKTIAGCLNLNKDLAETLALAHDLGHAPFGHTGQDVLNELMANHGGFEHNFNTLRIGIELESPYLEHKGLNLTYETLEGMLKHCSDKRAKQLYSSNDRFLSMLGERFLKRQSPSLEAQVVDYADAIAYLHADMQDAIHMKVLSPNDMASICKKFKDEWTQTSKKYPEIENTDERIIHSTIRNMMGSAIKDLIETSKIKIVNAKIKTLDDVRNSPELIQFSPEEKYNFLNLKKASRKLIYEHPQISIPHIEQAEKIKFLFSKYEQNPEIINIKENVGDIYNRICDHITMLTDRGVDREIERIYTLSNTSTKVIKMKR